MKKLVLAASLLFLSLDPLYSEDQEAIEPLYGGTLLAYFSTNAAPGYLGVQPYVFATQKYGAYNADGSLEKQKHINNLSMLLIFETGITNWLDIAVILNGIYNRSGKQQACHYGDTQLFLGLQLAKDQKGTWVPDLRLVIQENFPSGKYDHLNPKKLSVDYSGIGAYDTSFIVVANKIFYWFPRHPIDINLNLYFLLPTHANVEGFSVYGRGHDTQGVVRLGAGFITNLAFEYSLNRNWALGVDARYEHYSRAVFFSKKKQRTSVFVEFPSSERFSLAPCVEYSYSENLSMTIGPWFSIAGRNANAFVSLVGNVYCYF